MLLTLCIYLLYILLKCVFVYLFFVNGFARFAVIRVNVMSRTVKWSFESKY